MRRTLELTEAAARKLPPWKAKIVDQIRSAMDGIMRSLGGRDEWDKAEVNQYSGRITVQGAYRDWSIPKEGAYELGYQAYDELVKEVAGKLHKKVVAHMKAMDLWKYIKKVDVWAEEKSWVYAEAELKKRFQKPKETP